MEVKRACVGRPSTSRGGCAASSPGGTCLARGGLGSPAVDPGSTSARVPASSSRRSLRRHAYAGAVDLLRTGLEMACWSLRLARLLGVIRQEREGCGARGGPPLPAPRFGRRDSRHRTVSLPVRPPASPWWQLPSHQCRTCPHQGRSACCPTSEWHCPAPGRALCAAPRGRPARSALGSLDRGESYRLVGGQADRTTAAANHVRRAVWLFPRDEEPGRVVRPVHLDEPAPAVPGNDGLATVVEDLGQGEFRRGHGRRPPPSSLAANVPCSVATGTPALNCHVAEGTCDTGAVGSWNHPAPRSGTRTRSSSRPPPRDGRACDCRPLFRRRVVRPVCFDPCRPGVNTPSKGCVRAV